MAYTVSASSLYRSLEQLSNPEKKTILPKTLAVLTFLKFEYHEPTEEPRKPTLKGTSSSKTPSGGVARHQQ